MKGEKKKKNNSKKILNKIQKKKAYNILKNNDLIN